MDPRGAKLIDTENTNDDGVNKFLTKIKFEI